MATLQTLHPQLRQLKLSGMLDSLAARVEEARARPLDSLDFFLLLVEDELLRREAQAERRRAEALRSALNDPTRPRTGTPRSASSAGCSRGRVRSIRFPPPRRRGRRVRSHRLF